MLNEFKFYKGFKKSLNPFFPIFINKTKINIDFVITKFIKNEGYNLLFGIKNSKNNIKIYFINTGDNIDLYLNFNDTKHYKLIGTIDYNKYNNIKISGLKNDEICFTLNNNLLFWYPNYFLNDKIIIGMKPKLFSKTKNKFSIFINYFFESENILKKKSKLNYWNKFSFNY